LYWPLLYRYFGDSGTKYRAIALIQVIAKANIWRGSHLFDINLKYSDTITKVEASATYARVPAKVLHLIGINS
jgi:hypothetical protein